MAQTPFRGGSLLHLPPLHGTARPPKPATPGQTGHRRAGPPPPPRAGASGLASLIYGQPGPNRATPRGAPSTPARRGLWPGLSKPARHKTGGAPLHPPPVFCLAWRPGPGPPPRAGASPAPPGPPGGGPKKVTPPTADPLALFQFSTENRRATLRQDARFLTRQGCSTLQKTRMSISVISTKCSYRARRAAVLDGKSEKMPRAK